MTWTTKQIRQHKKAAELLEKIKNETFAYIRKHPRCTERDALELIQELYKLYNLKSAVADPIVAFGPSSFDFHYRAPKRGSRKLKPGTLIMLDIWARLNEPRAPFADMTWMAFYSATASGVPKEVERVFDTVIRARDASLKVIRIKIRSKELPTGREVDTAAMRVLTDAGYKIRTEILHTTGHPLGTTSPHGRYSRIAHNGTARLQRNLGYTIEPGLYIKKRFGVRSEIDFYIAHDYTLVITTPVQRRLHII